VHCLLTYYRMGSLLYWLLGGCALWPGWMGRVTICPTLSGGYSPWQPFADCGCKGRCCRCCFFFFFFFFFKSTIYYAVLNRSPRQTIQTKYSPRVYMCKIGREITALMSPFRAVMSPARAKRGQENNKESWVLRCLPKPALAPDVNHPLHAQPTPEDVPSRSRTCVYLAT
jgi:hypothetical protein